jgi:hypothetical protein
MEEYKNRIAVRKPHGNFSIVDPALPSVLEGDTLRCCHCGAHWVPIKGSGRKRGFCMKCMDVTCGSFQCMECLPHDKMLDLIEKQAKIVNSIRG